MTNKKNPVKNILMRSELSWSMFQFPVSGVKSITEHCELEVAHYDHQSPTPGPVLVHPRVTPCSLEHFPNAP